MKQNLFSIWYFALSIVFIILGNLHFVFPAFVAKILIIPSLMVFYHLALKGKYVVFHRLMMIGLFFSWLGDTILESANLNTIPVSLDLLFIGGLGSFLLTHIFYFFAFNVPEGKNTILSTRKHLVLPVVLYGIVMIYFLYDNLGGMKTPVITYTLIIILMLLSALNREGKVNGKSYNLVLSGALLFVISDSLLAVNRFHGSIGNAGVLIMISYVAAQYLIILGCLRQDILSRVQS
jgi:uncharacterized membrane protein YhhN